MLGLASPLLVRPADLLVSADARLIGVRLRDAVYLQQESGASRFTRDAWLQYWATGAPVAMPADGAQVDGAIACREEACLLRPVRNAKAALLVRGASHPAGCAEASVIVSAEPARGLCARPWPALVDRFTVWRYGATAIWLMGGARQSSRIAPIGAIGPGCRRRLRRVPALHRRYRWHSRTDNGGAWTSDDKC